MITTYYYAKQLKNYILQFANIFAGMEVKTGKGADGTISTIEVPVVYGSKDRLVAMLGSGNTQNKLHTLPMMSVYLLNIEPAADRRKGTGGVNRRTYMEQGGVFPDDVRVAYQIMPYPFDLQMEMSLYASNTDQAFQILEQLLIIFDPTLQIQTSDAPLDWTKISSVELTGINNEENHPSGTEKRQIIWTLSFTVDAWLTPPMEVRDNIVKRIIMQIGDMEKFSLFEYDDAGEPQPFSEDGKWTDIIIDAPNETIDNDPNVVPDRDNPRQDDDASPDLDNDRDDQ